MRRLFGPAMILALATLLGVVIGGRLAQTVTVGDSPLPTLAVTGANGTPLPAGAGSLFEVVSGPAMATMAVATVQARETQTGHPAGMNQGDSSAHAGICVHDASGSQLRPEALAGQVRAAIDTIYVNAGQLPPPPMKIATPCPTPPPLLDPRVTGVRHETLVGGPSNHVVYASGFQTFIYIVPDEAIGRFFAGKRPEQRSVNQEGHIVGHTSVFFASAYYLTLNEFQSINTFQRVLASVLRLHHLLPKDPSAPAIEWAQAPILGNPPRPLALKQR